MAIRPAHYATTLAEHVMQAVIQTASHVSLQLFFQVDVALMDAWLVSSGMDLNVNSATLLATTVLALRRVSVLLVTKE